MAVEVASAYVSLVPSAKGFAEKITGEIGGGLTGAGTAAGSLVGGDLIGSIISTVKNNAGKIGALLTGGAFVGAAKGIYDIGASFDDAFDKIRVATGTTGAQFDGLKGSFNTVFADVPASADDVSTAISTLSVKLGLTGPPLETLATQVLNLSRITGTDLNANLAATTDVFNSFGIAAADQPGKLDELFRASQATGTSVTDLAANMASAGPNLTQLGFSFEQSAGLVGIFGKAGVDVSAIMPALSKTIAAAAKDGKNAGDVFKDTFDKIKNAPDDTTAAGAAIDVFGAKAGPKLAGLIRQGKLGYDELAQSIAAGGDTINSASSDTADFSEKWGTFKNKILVGLQPIAEKVFGAVGDAMDKLGPAVGPIISQITDGFGGLVTVVGPVIDEIIGSVRAFFTAFSAGDGDVTSSGLPGFMEKVANAARGIFDAIRSIDFKAVFAEAKDIITPIVDALGGLAATSFETLKSAVTTLIQLFKDNKDTIVTVLDVVKGGLTDAIKVLTDVMGFLGDHMDAVKAIAIPLVAAFVLYKATVGTITAVTKVWTAVQAVFNAVMALNPIGIVVIAIAALVAGVIYAYTHFDSFRAIIDTVWQVIQTVFHWITDNWPLLLAILLGPFGVAILLVVDNFDTIKGAAEAVFNWIKDNWQLILEILTGPIGLAVLVITTFWGTIKDTFTTVKDWIAGRIDDIVGFFVGLPGRVWAFIDGLYQQIKDGITGAKDWIFGRIEDIVGFYTGLPGRVWGVISGLYENIKNGITGAKDWIHDRVEDIFNMLSGLPGRLSGIFSGMFDGIGRAMSGAVALLKAAWNSIPSVTIPGFHIPGTSIGFDGVTISVPKMAEGGIVTQPTLALLGEAGMEAVIPLSRAGVGSLPDQGGDKQGAFRDLIINPRSEASAQQIAREVRWAQLTAGV